MAEVTGQIGNEYVELDNAATEATLQDLLKATAAMARTAKVDTKQAQQELEKLYKSSRGLNVEQIRARQNQRRLTAQAVQVDREKSDNLVKLRETEADYNKTKLQSRTNLLAFAKSIENLISVTINVTRALASMGDSLSGAANTFSNIPIVGGLLSNYLGAIAGAVENAQRGFVNISSIGATMGGSLTGVIRAAGQAGLTVDQFTGIVAKNGEGLARLGEGTEDGFRRFRTMSQLMRTEVNNGLSNLGITTEEANDVLASYSARLARDGRARNMSEEALVKASSDYLVNLTAVSRLTGATRRELEEQAANRERDASWNNWLASLEDPDIAIAGREAMALFDSMGVGDLARDMIVAGAPLSEVTARLGAMSPALMSTLEAFGNAAESGDKGALEQLRKQAFEETRGLATELKESGLDQALRVLAAQGDPAAQAILAVANAGRALTGNYDEVVASVQTDLAKAGTEMAAAVAVQQAIAERSANVQEKLVGRLGDLITALNHLDLIMPAAIAGAVAIAIGAALGGRKLLNILGGRSGGIVKGGNVGAVGGGSSMAGMGKAALRIARFAGPLALAAGAMYSASKGVGKTAEYFDLVEGETANLGQKIASGIGGVVATFTGGLVDGAWVAKSYYAANQALVDGFSAVAGSVTTMFNDPEGTMKSLGDSIHAGFVGATNFVSGMWTGMKESKLGEAISSEFNSAKHFVIDSWDSATSIMNQWGQSIADGYASAKNFAAKSWQSAGITLKEWGDQLKNGYDNLRTQATGMISSAVSKAKELTPQVEQALTKTADAAKAAVASGWNRVTSFFAQSPAEVVDAVKNQPGTATADSLPASGAATPSTAQTSSENAESNLNTKLDELIRITYMMYETNEKQLSVQRSFGGDLQAAV